MDNGKFCDSTVEDLKKGQNLIWWAIFVGKLNLIDFVVFLLL